MLTKHKQTGGLPLLFQAHADHTKTTVAFANWGDDIVVFLNTFTHTRKPEFWKVLNNQPQQNVWPIAAVLCNVFYVIMLESH